MIKTIWTKMFPPPTPDQELIKQLKDAVREVARLGAEANDRGIVAYLNNNGFGTGHFMPHWLKFVEAYRTEYKTERFE